MHYTLVDYIKYDVATNTVTTLKSWMQLKCHIWLWPSALCPRPLRRVHLHDVRVDHLVSVQHVMWDGPAVQGTLRQAVPWRWLCVYLAYWGEREVYCERRMQWVALTPKINGSKSFITNIAAFTKVLVFNQVNKHFLWYRKLLINLCMHFSYKQIYVFLCCR